MRIAVTGASGFIGTHLVPLIHFAGLDCVPFTREPGVAPGRGFELADIQSMRSMAQRLEGCDTVVHLGGLAHQPRSQRRDTAYLRAVNVDGAGALSVQAARAGVRRFIFVSTAKVHGDRSLDSKTISVTSRINALDPYAQSKRDAEFLIDSLNESNGLDVVVLRPPLVFGPGVRANFASLISAVAHGFPLPLAAVSNARSYIGVTNLCDLIVRAAVEPLDMCGAYLVSDCEDLSTPDLIERIAHALRVSARLFPMSPRLLAGLATLAGQRAAVNRLCESFRVDSTPIRQRLRWTPPASFDEELAATVHAHRASTPGMRRV